MAEAEPGMAHRWSLHVAVLAASAGRREALAARVSELGHLVTDAREAEIVLADSDAALPELPAVVLEHFPISTHRIPLRQDSFDIRVG
jgi:hypothetical protein